MAMLGILPKVAFHDGDFRISTISDVPDSEHSFETAVAHREYYGGKWICVEEYDTVEQALAGHEKWVETMKNLPDQIIDISTSEEFKSKDEVRGHSNWRVHPRHRGKRKYNVCAA